MFLFWLYVLAHCPDGRWTTTQASSPPASKGLFRPVLWNYFLLFNFSWIVLKTVPPNPHSEVVWTPCIHINLAVWTAIHLYLSGNIQEHITSSARIPVYLPLVREEIKQKCFKLEGLLIVADYSCDFQVVKMFVLFFEKVKRPI